jgi:hypothetical protein
VLAADADSVGAGLWQAANNSENAKRPLRIIGMK